MASTANFDKAMELFTDFDYYEEVGAGFAGFFLPTLLKVGVENYANFDLPDELYGVVVAAGAQVAPVGDHEEFISLGGGLYAADVAAGPNRLGIKGRATRLVGNAGGN